MADIDVQPKRSSPWWLWVLILVIVIAVGYYLLKGRSSRTTEPVTTDSTTTNSTNR